MEAVAERPTRRSGVLGDQSQYAARPLRWSDLDRLLEQAGAPAPCQISIPKPVYWGTPKDELRRPVEGRQIWSTRDSLRM